MMQPSGNSAQKQRSAATWVPNTRCPECRSQRVFVTRTMPVEPGETIRIRYHRCRNRACRALFASVETLD